MNMAFGAFSVSEDDRIRLSRRLRYGGTVGVHLDANALRVALLARDVSATGVFLESSILLTEGTPLTVAFDTVEGVVETHGYVVRVQEPSDGRVAGMGVAFETRQDALMRALFGVRVAAA